MLEMIKGAKVPKPEILQEGYQVLDSENYQYIRININASKIKSLFESFIKQNPEELFLILEVPCPKDEEPLDEAGNLIDLHSNIYYLDNISQTKALEILNRYECLINDGIVAFGFATHKSLNELMKYKYNVLILYSNDLDKYQEILKEKNIPQVKELLTAWDTFDEKKCGESSIICDIENILEELKKEGLYFYKQTIRK